MAYIDKVTTMRRMTLINQYSEHGNGAIAYEGVNIEGTCLLRKVGLADPCTIIALEVGEELERFTVRYNLQIKYQDPENEDFWEPRLEEEL